METKNINLEINFKTAQQQFEEGQKLLEAAKKDLTYKINPKFCTTLFEAKQKLEKSLEHLEFCEIETKRGDAVSLVINEFREKVSQCLKEINDTIEPPKTEVRNKKGNQKKTVEFIKKEIQNTKPKNTTIKLLKTQKAKKKYPKAA